MNIQDIADAATRIYGRRYKALYEKEHPNWFVVVDIKNEEAYVHETPEGAFLAARKEAPHGVFHLMKVGSTGAFTGGERPTKAELPTMLVG